MTPERLEYLRNLVATAKPHEDAALIAMPELASLVTEAERLQVVVQLLAAALAGRDVHTTTCKDVATLAMRAGRQIWSDGEEIDRLTPKWQEGEPSLSESHIWREGTTDEPTLIVEVCRLARGGPVHYRGGIDAPFWTPWGTARWSPIVRPV